MFRKTVICVLAVVVLALGGQTWAAEKGEKGEKAAVKAEKRPQQRQGQFMQGQDRQGQPNAAQNQVRMQAWVGEFTRAYRQKDQEKMEQLIDRLNKAGEQSGPPVSRVAKAITDAYEQKDREKMEQILKRMNEGMGRMQEQRGPGADSARPQERGPMQGRGPGFEDGGRERFQSPIGPQQPEPEMLRQFGQGRMGRQQQAPWEGMGRMQEQRGPGADSARPQERGPMQGRGPGFEDGGRERFQGPIGPQQPEPEMLRQFGQGRMGRQQQAPWAGQMAPERFDGGKQRQPNFNVRSPGRFGNRQGRQPQFGFRGQGRFGQGMGNRFGMQQQPGPEALRQLRQRRMERLDAAPSGQGYNYPMWQIPRGNFQW